MLIRTGFDIRFETDREVPMLALLSVRPERCGDLRTPEVLNTEPSVPVSRYVDSFGNVASRLVVPAGGIRLFSDFVIADEGTPDPVVADAEQHPVPELPDEALIYLLSSRYCEVELLADEAWAIAGSITGGWARVQALVDAAHERLQFDYQRASSARTARSAWDERTGVCRDFAHLAITLCRAVNIPARYCTGYLGDIGIDPVDYPMDFSAWFEVYLGGAWHTFDARHNRPRIGRIAMARGRDAVDTALTTSFGKARLTRFEVHTVEVASADLDRPVADAALPQRAVPVPGDAA
ncbi:transglutaminase family protein [Erythrobacteraceae bacterium CFH 75059]|uniref:transglutaminase-like domain-containing protein n=1 Tax=Qipengyuania thermophila TaxID=2509361 RepID=UPI00102184AF|nr:transglutaminase family protein [Qipengyuania thermophila]TCD04309.1 transglutaminase family protein [Erythrobacteraceae bacterium CFH 75059]